MKKYLFLFLILALLLPVTSSATTTASTTEQTITQIQAKLDAIVKALEKLKEVIAQMKDSDRMNGTDNYGAFSGQSSKSGSSLSGGQSANSSKSPLGGMLSSFSGLLSNIVGDLLGVSQPKYLPESFGPEFDSLIKGDENSVSPLTQAEIDAAIKNSAAADLAGSLSNTNGSSFSGSPTGGSGVSLPDSAKATHLNLINTGKSVDGNPLLVLVMIKDNQQVGAVGAVSGVYAGTGQGDRLTQGSKTPLPNGLYPVGKPLETPKIYAKTGQKSIPLSSELVPGSTREALFIHKRIGNGTAGCIGVITKEDHEKVIKFVDDFYAGNPQGKLILGVKI